MHTNSMIAMDSILDKWTGSASVLDVGSLDVNGSYREMVERRGWSYTGLDLKHGRNVDIVASDQYQYPVDDGAYDIVISGSTMEHVQAIWQWVPELVRIVRAGGMLAVYTHSRYPEHRYPVDCWRIMADGMEYLFSLCSDLLNYDIAYVGDTDIYGVGWKVA